MFFDDLSKIIGHKPHDLRPVPDEHFQAVQAQLAQGKVLDADATGMPVAVDHPQAAEAAATAAAAAAAAAATPVATVAPLVQPPAGA